MTIKDKQFFMKFHCLSVWHNVLFLHHIAQNIRVHVGLGQDVQQDQTHHIISVVLKLSIIDRGYYVRPSLGCKQRRATNVNVSTTTKLVLGKKAEL